jgi:hypothetical protein
MNRGCHRRFKGVALGAGLSTPAPIYLSNQGTRVSPKREKILG